METTFYFSKQCLLLWGFESRGSHTEETNEAHPDQ